MTTLGNLLGSTQTAPLTMASAFATFANDGKYCEPIAITSVTDQTGAQLPAQVTSLPGRPQARGGPWRELCAAGSAERGIRFTDPAPDLHRDQLPDRCQDRYVQQQRLHLGCRPHHRAWRRLPGSATRSAPSTAPGQNLTVNGKFYTGIDGYMIAGPMFSNFMSQIAPALRHGTVPGTALEPAVRHAAVPAPGSEQPVPGRNTGGNTDTGTTVEHRSTGNNGQQRATETATAPRGTADRD